MKNYTNPKHLTLILTFMVLTTCQYISFGQFNNDCINALCLMPGQDYIANNSTGVDDMVGGACLGNNGLPSPVETNPAWFYFEVEESGSLTLTFTTTADYDYIIWGPFSSLDDAIQNGCNGSIVNTQGNSPEISCDYSVATPDIDLPLVNAGEVYFLLLDDWMGDPSPISTSISGTASLVECQTCVADCTMASTSSCAHYVSELDSIPSISEVVENDGVSQLHGIVLSAGNDTTITQCYEYMHSTPNATGFAVWNGYSGTVQCSAAIFQISIYDETCGEELLVIESFGAGITNAQIGSLYKVCVSITFSHDGTQGTCIPSGFLNSIIPFTIHPYDSDGDGIRNAVDLDFANRYICGDIDLDGCEDCLHGFSDPNNDGPDNDNDGICDSSDTDDDNDGVADVNDAAPFDSGVN